MWKNAIFIIAMSTEKEKWGIWQHCNFRSDTHVDRLSTSQSFHLKIALPDLSHHNLFIPCKLRTLPNLLHIPKANLISEKYGKIRSLLY